jgi:hypothetical protein
MEYHLKNICWAYWRFALARPMQRKITTAAIGQQRARLASAPMVTKWPGWWLAMESRS